MFTKTYCILCIAKVRVFTKTRVKNVLVYMKPYLRNSTMFLLKHKPFMLLKSVPMFFCDLEITWMRKELKQQY